VKRTSFSERYTGNGPRYGQLFRAVRKMPCWLLTQKYTGKGHESCGFGAQGGWTAHHVGRNDKDGLVPCCGAAHDLLAGLGGSSTRQEFEAWLKRYGFDLKEVGKRYVARVNGGRDDA
jgi:hypothetical protein